MYMICILHGLLPWSSPLWAAGQKGICKPLPSLELTRPGWDYIRHCSGSGHINQSLRATNQVQHNLEPAWCRYFWILCFGDHLLSLSSFNPIRTTLCKLGQWVRAPHMGDQLRSSWIFYMLKVYVRPAPGQILGVLGFWNLLEFDFLQ